MITYPNDIDIVFGVPEEILPLTGFPEGRVRFRIRNGEWLICFVRTATGIRKFYVGCEGGFFIPRHEIARNVVVDNFPAWKTLPAYSKRLLDADSLHAKAIGVTAGDFLRVRYLCKCFNTAKQLFTEAKGLDLDLIAVLNKDTVLSDKKEMTAQYWSFLCKVTPLLGSLPSTEHILHNSTCKKSDL